MSCTHTTNCDLYVQFAADPSIQLWKKYYCDNDFRKCARFNLSLKGQHVPLNLLPNGKVIEVQANDEERGMHALFNAIQKNRLQMVKTFLKTKMASGTVVNVEGLSPAMYAASLGRSEIMRFLLENGCDPHHRNKKGETALDLAIKAGHNDCVEIFYEYASKTGPSASQARTKSENQDAAGKNSLVGRMMGFLRGHKPGQA